MYLSLLMAAANAGEARFTFLGVNEPAPFEGALFNPEATAELIVAPKEVQLNCDLEFEYQIDLLQTEHQLIIQNMNSRYNALNVEYQQAISAKDLQIENLETVISSNSGVSKWVWFTGGLVGGSALTYSAYRAFNVN